MAVCVSGGDVVQEAAGIAENVVHKALADRPAALGVDSSWAGSSTSAGLNVLIQVRRGAVAAGVPLVLIVPSKRVRPVLRPTGTGRAYAS
ncbi:hypothetical protein BX266_7075 [Streptomyces sp. TLI_171]|nr:hypothetical protein BX266_7075 [Streptomyces sp. TLI_171]